MSVFVIDRSAFRVTAVWLVSELLPGVRSVVVLVLMLAVFVRSPGT